MAISNYSIPGTIVVVNGFQIQSWGATDPAMTIDPIDPKRVLMRCLGGGAVTLSRSNEGRSVTLNLQPGSPDAAFLSGLYNSGATVTFSYTQIGTLETATGLEGVVVNVGQTGRAGMSVTDDQFVIEFNHWVETKGGE